MSAAEVRLHIDHRFIDSYLLRESHEDSWYYTVLKQDPHYSHHATRLFDTYGGTAGGKTRRPGQHFVKYQNPFKTFRGTLEADRLLLENFLKPLHDRSGLKDLWSVQELGHIGPCAAVASNNNELRALLGDAGTAEGDEPKHESTPIIAPPYLRIEEKRIALRELMVDDATFMGGIHFPLLLSVVCAGRRSKEAQERRIEIGRQGCRIRKRRTSKLAKYRARYRSCGHSNTSGPVMEPHGLGNVQILEHMQGWNT